MDVLNSPKEVERSAYVLGVAGLAPFAGAALLMWVPQDFLSPNTVRLAGIGYGAVILSFLGGIRWGAALGPFGGRRPARDFSLSVVSSLAGWSALLLPPIPGLCLLIAGFLIQALWDVIAVEAGRLPPWFGKLRTLLTTGAVAALIAMLVKLAL